MLSISGCANTKNGSENINDKSKISTKTPSTQGKSDLNKFDENEIKDLEASFKEPNDLKKPNIEDARNFEESFRYVILENKNTPDDMGVSVISFDKSNVKK